MHTYDHFTIPEATALQQEMRKNIRLESSFSGIHTIGGADISFNKDSTEVYAGIVVLTYPGMMPIGRALFRGETTFPYVPGYLAFREIPSLQRAWELFPSKPDVMVLDGQGILHPRRMGIAAHFGVLNNWPAIGCAKTMLHGTHYEPGPERFSTSPIASKDELLGYALRTKAKTAPVYISPGNLVSVEDSLDIMKNCVRQYRIPEPTRLAHETVNLFRLGKLSEGYEDISNAQQSLF